MLLVDRVLDITPGKNITAIKNVTRNEPFFNGHFPNQPVMPGVLIVEAMAQAGGILMLYEMEKPSEKLIYFTGIDKVKFRRPEFLFYFLLPPIPNQAETLNWNTLLKPV